MRKKQMQKNYMIKLKKMQKFATTEDFYNTFYNNTKKKIINLIKETLNGCKLKYK